jgi:hypothetical protein
MQNSAHTIVELSGKAMAFLQRQICPNHTPEILPRHTQNKEQVVRSANTSILNTRAKHQMALQVSSKLLLVAAAAAAARSCT